MGCMCSKNKSNKESGNMEVKIQKYLEQQQCTCGISYDQIQIQIIPLQCNHKLCINCFRRAFSENSVLCPFCFKVQTYDQPLEILNTHVDQQNSSQAIDTQNQIDSSEQQISNQQVPAGESQELNIQTESKQVKENISEEGKKQAKSNQNKTQNKEESKNSSKKDKNQIQ